MHFKYTLSGSMVVEGEEAEKMFNIISNRRFPTESFWVYWNDAEGVGDIKIKLKTISAKFEILCASRSYVNSVVSRGLELKNHDCSSDTREIYLMMLEQCKKSECKAE
jgi:hypothetical protein